MREQKYVIPGDPIPWTRAVPMSYGKVWDKQKQQKFAFGLQLLNQHNGTPLFKGPIEAEIYFCIQIPKSHHKKIEEMRGKYHYFRPDASNLTKFLEDSGNKVIFNDDCQIASLSAKKVWYDIAQTILIIRELGDEKVQIP